jgi:hypothetical protein
MTREIVNKQSRGTIYIDDGLELMVTTRVCKQRRPEKAEDYHRDGQ